MPIHLLPPEVASQIAAGEVVERPASVVKELVENALDAKATHIEIKIEEAGLRLIEVSDNGAGILSEDLPLALERHATSKLERAEDLFTIATLGFRGEALASIASVSRLTITSRTEEADLGARLLVEGGKAESLHPIGAPAGTVVRVEDLFYNVPARLKFLKHPTTEKRHIDALVTNYALAYPEVRFHLYQDGRPVLQTSGNRDRREILASLYGVDIARPMLEVFSEDRNLMIRGYISPPSVTRSNRREIQFFVNGRPIQDTTLTAALLKGYHTLLMTGRFPYAAILIEIPPDQVDVNVHPAKAEIRFRDANLIFSGVQNAVRRALLAYTPVPTFEEELRWSSSPWRTENDRLIDPSWSFNATDEGPADTAPQVTTTGIPSPAQSGLPEGKVPLLRPIGQIAASYLVAEGPDGLYLVDQHAAHERVLFERYMAQRKTTIPAQNLLQPVVIELPAGSTRLLNEQLPVLTRLGFQVELFGAHSFQIRAIPALLQNTDPAAALRVVIEDFEEDETPLQAEIEAKIIARVCKRAAVKAGQVLSPEEQRTLLQDLENCQSPRTCPHGRPTMIHLSVDLLERQFGRKGAR